MYGWTAAGPLKVNPDQVITMSLDVYLDKTLSDTQLALR